ncbi:hypothetical protein AOB46_19190 [Chryseobacterium indologenes]|uniref:Uncharacterized protein n=1 Tax=Chryseobacterium indologenes TaxID=253 RepID=A0A0N1KT05_CHRID|nr:hypothetical protein AOB46_19190 [Chryseobacterium indologenes]
MRKIDPAFVIFVSFRLLFILNNYKKNIGKINTYFPYIFLKLKRVCNNYIISLFSFIPNPLALIPINKANIEQKIPEFLRG